MDNVVKFPAENISNLKLPKLISYRGACSYAPENTLVSLHTAADMGAEWVSIDVKLSKDGEPILFHDDSLERTALSSGKIAELSWKELQQLDVGVYFSDSFGDERIPHLEQALDVIIDRGMGINIGISSCPGREKETAEIALDWLTRYWPDDFAVPLISSVQAVSLETSMFMVPDYNRAYMISSLEEDSIDQWQEKARHLDVSVIGFDVSLFQSNPELVNEIIGFDYSTMCFVVNNFDRAEELLEMGVKTILSGEPDLL